MDRLAQVDQARPPMPQGFFRHNPTVGPVPHFAPSGAPPLGQKTDTSVSLGLAAHRAIGLDSPNVHGRGPLRPFSPFSPGVPWSSRP